MELFLKLLGVTTTLHYKLTDEMRQNKTLLMQLVIQLMLVIGW